MGFGDLFRSSRKSSRRAPSTYPQDEFPGGYSETGPARDAYISGSRRHEFIPVSVYAPESVRPSSSRSTAWPLDPPREYFTRPSTSSRSRPVSPVGGYYDSRSSSSRRDRTPVSPIDYSRSSSSRRHAPSGYGDDPPRYASPSRSSSCRRDSPADVGYGVDMSSLSGGFDPYTRSSSRSRRAPAQEGYGVDLSTLGGGYNPYASSSSSRAPRRDPFVDSYGSSTREYRPYGR